MDKVLWGYLSVGITLAGYAIYIASMYRTTEPKKRIKPHPLSWALFGFLTATGWLIQKSQDGQAGSWCLGVTALFCFVIAGISFWKYPWKFEWKDWVWIVAGMALFLFYLITKTPTLSATLATLADLVGYGPTLRKGWREPHTDNPTNFAFNSAKCIPALLALASYSWATMVYLVMLTIMNGGVTFMLIARRARVKV
ncbi:hypothetical protein M1413_00800 [Patescibacteria group bacterium]|nr:hypothetical protein [Patescibacteria group bacterium]MCL5114298.1 hypothetical protein [Patescibacteria group bacterium]